MKKLLTLGSVVSALLVLSACSTVDDLFDEPIEPPPAPVAAPPAPDSPRTLGRIGDFDRRTQASLPSAPPPPLDLDAPQGTGSVRAVSGTAPSGTFVGKKALQIRGDLTTLQRSIATHKDQLERLRATTRGAAEQFHGIVASINARLQIGTTPGNPILGRQWADAQARLAEVSDNVLRMEELRSRVATDSALAGFLVEQVQAAYSLSGAVEEDHRQLAALEDDVNRAIVQIERVLGDIDGDIQRQTSYITRERRNLTTLALAIKNGELYGPSLSSTLTNGVATTSRNTSATQRKASAASRTAPRVTNTAAKSVKSPPASVQAAADRAARSASAKQPVAVIHFANSNVEYEPSLYAAISDAVARDPSASFEVVAVSPGAKPGASITSAKRKARRVLRSLMNMGVPENRLRESAQTSQQADDDQVHVFML